MNNGFLTILFFGITSFFSITAFSQVNFNQLQITHTAMTKNAAESEYWLGIMGLPFMLLSVFFASATANKMKNCKFGKGMKFRAWGFLVMATGHAHMQSEAFSGINLFGWLLGAKAGQVTWLIALLCTRSNWQLAIEP